MISWFEKHNKLSWVVTFGIAAFIFYVSTLSFEVVSKGGFGYKGVVYHVSVFFVLSLFLMISSVGDRSEKKELILFLAVLLGVLYGVSDELHQSFVPNRSSAVFDVFLDSLGVFLAFLVYWVSILYRSYKR